MKKFIQFILLLSFPLCSVAQNSTEHYGVFFFNDSLLVPGNTNFVYDNISGDISGWWDHTMSENPDSLFIDAKPGGGFYEYFDKKGNGAKHATVILADRGKILRFEGPLGLSGRAIQMVTTYNFYSQGKDSTKILLTVNASGQVQKGLKEIVASVWHHFLHERFSPYIIKQFNIQNGR